jgi:F-box/TPR repeat protein Pof3
MVEPAIRAGKLSTLDIVFPMDDGSSPEGHNSIQHLRGYNWLRGAEAIRSIGVTGFRFVSVPRNNDDFPLLGFLASFPNLETLEISSEAYDEGGIYSVLREVIQAVRVKALYQSQVKGAPLDALKAAAKERDIVLHWGERPRPWPLQLEP